MSLTPEINKAIATTEDTNSMLTSLLKSSISKEDNERARIQQMGKKLVQYEATIKKLTDSQRVWLDEFEARFDNDECPSHEIAKQYIDDATYMREAFKRNDAGFINRVQDWYDNQPLPFKIKN
jgi:hypothetical protein